MAKTTFRIIGLPRSGTTWIEGMLDRNFDGVNVLSGEKHCMVHQFTPEVDSKILLIVKRADHWVESAKRNPSQIMRRYPFIFADGVLDEKAATVFHSLFNAAWAPKAHMIVDYATVLRDPCAFLDGVCRRFGLSRRWNEWKTSGPRILTGDERAHYLTGTE